MDLQLSCTKLFADELTTFLTQVFRESIGKEALPPTSVGESYF